MLHLLKISLIVFILSCINQTVNAATNIYEYKTYVPKPGSLVHVVTVDLRKAKFIIGRSQDLGQGLDSVENIAKHYGAIIAVNGGFFRFNTSEFNSGVPAGVLKINNYWHGIAYKPRGCIGWSPQTGQIVFDILQTKSSVLINNKHLPINMMNKLSSGNKAALISNSYYDPVNIDNKSLALLISNKHIEKIYTFGTVTVPKDAYIYYLHGKLRDELFDNIKPHDSAIVDISLKPQINKNQTSLWNKLPYVLGGGPLLLNNGSKINDFSIEGMSNDFIHSNYARTAIGILSDKRLILLVAEQNALQNVIGLSIPELRDFMYSLGCVQALNLDGGGSSAMYIQNTKYSSITEHPVADVVLVLPN